MVFHFATSLREICIVREIVIVQVSRFVVFADVIIDFLGVVRAEAVLGAHASSSLIPAKLCLSTSEICAGIVYACSEVVRRKEIDVVGNVRASMGNRLLQTLSFKEGGPHQRESITRVLFER